MALTNTEVKEIEVPSKSLKTLVKKAVNRIDDNIDGFVDKEDKKVGPYGETRNIPKNFKIKEWTNRSGVSANQREVGTDTFREYTKKMSGTKAIRNFINKYKAKSKLNY